MLTYIPSPWRFAAVLALVAAAAVLAGPAVDALEITGRATVTDGDTLRVGGARIRLHGIDAPESAQTCADARGRRYPCGRDATRALEGMAGGRSVRCAVRDTDRHRRAVAVCRLGGRDLNAWMVLNGHALAYRRYSRDYISLETEARAGRRGMWRGTFEAPWDWRRARR